MTMNHAFRLAAVVAVVFLCTQPIARGDEAKSGGSDKNRPNIVLVVADDLGPDLGCYGNDAIHTPNIDRLASQGVRLRNAFCTTASCSASRSVILTGLYNHANAQYGHEHSFHHFRTYDNLKSLPVLLAEVGYRTARIGKLHVGPESVYRFDVALPGGARSPVQMAENCKEFVSARDDRPFFLYYCTADPHRSGARVADDPHRPDAFGNRPQGYPGVEAITYEPDDVHVPAFLPDTPTCRAELAQYYQSVSRVDQGVGRLVEVLREAGTIHNTLIVFTSDHGIAFPGAKTTLYEPGMVVPMIVAGPGIERRGQWCDAMVSLVDITPMLLDAAGALPDEANADDAKADAENLEVAKAESAKPDAAKLHGRSFLAALNEEKPDGWDEVFASHTFHEITMYYPMRCVRTRQYKLIWNIAHGLPYPFASDLWEAPTWQDVYQRGPDALYGRRTIRAYIHRPKFELFDLESDPDETTNLADDPRYADVLQSMQGRIKEHQNRTSDPWILKWEYE